jgi:DUF4097 and DUF4098 domain-containing protein YvlB
MDLVAGSADLTEDRKMSRRFKVSTAIAMIAFVIVIAKGVMADDEWKKVDRGGDLKFDETFDFAPDDRLFVDVQDADIEVVQGSDGKARVEVYVLSRSSDRAQEYFEDSHFRARMRDGTLDVETRFPRNRGWQFWEVYRSVDMRVIVTIPGKASAQLKTDDGDIRVGTFTGVMRARTSDGDIRVGTLDGEEIKLETSDGDIRADKVTGKRVRLETSDGDLRAESIEADEIILSSSDGNVDVERATGGIVSMRTSDGDIDIDVEAEKLSASTSDGDINVAIRGNTALNLRTHDGNVTIKGPSGLDADLDLRGERVSLGGKVSIEGEVSRRRVRGSIGDGGPEIVARTSDGRVRLDLN